MAEFNFPDATPRPSLGRQIFSRIGQRNELAQDRQALSRDKFNLQQESRRFDEDLKQKNYDLDLQEFDLKKQGADLELMKTQSAIMAKRLEDARALQTEKDAASMLDALSKIDVSSDTAQKQITSLVSKYPRALENPGVQKVLGQWNSDSEQFLKYRVGNLQRQEQDERAAIVGDEADRLGMKPKSVRTTTDGITIDYEQPVAKPDKSLQTLNQARSMANFYSSTLDRMAKENAAKPGAHADDTVFGLQKELARQQAIIDGFDGESPSAPAPVVTPQTPSESLANVNALKDRLRQLNRPTP